MADISTDLSDWSSNEAANSPSGATTIGSGLDDNLRAIQAGVKGWTENVAAKLWKGAISGLIQSQAADTDHDITISAGACIDGTGAESMVLASAITKQIDAAWAVGTNAGGMDTGTVGNSTWYYIWLIKRSDTGVVDALFSTSATAPTMPTSYDYKRLIGAVKTDGSANILGFNAYELFGGGLEVAWKAPILDVDLTNTLTTSRRTDTLSVPTAFSTVATIRARAFDASANHNTLISCPDETDAAPSTSASPGHNLSAGTGVSVVQEMKVRTSATGTVASRSSLSTVDDYKVFTVGFEWSRR